jgi:hypothetical protein
VKQSEAKFKSIFSLFFAFFHFFSLFPAFFCFFPLFFALNFSLRFDLVIFASKQNKAKRNSSLFFVFFAFFLFFSLFFAFFHFFSLNFRFASIFSLNFRLFYLRFRFRFLVFRIEVNHVKSGFFFASKRNEIFASISNFASEAKVRAHPRWKGMLPLPQHIPQFWTRPAPNHPQQMLKPQVLPLLPPSPKRQLRLLVLLQQLGPLQLRIGTRRKQLPPLALLKHGGFGSNINLWDCKPLLNGSA